MQMIAEKIKEKIKELTENGKISRVMGWKKGLYGYDSEPFVFENGDLRDFTYDAFSGANLCKYMIAQSRNDGDGKILVLLKPCDTWGFELLDKEHRIKRENIYALGIPCGGMVDIEKIKKSGVKGITEISEKEDTLILKTMYGEKEVNKKDYLLDKCLVCSSKEYKDCDELFMTDLCGDTAEYDRFEEVEKLEKLSSSEKFEFWRSQLEKCIRCNACRNVCPACSCVKCVFDNDNSGVAAKANANDFEENLFHIIRAFHVCGRCVDCGECSRVCPQNIPLHLLNRKYIKDIKELYGDEDEAALLTFTTEDKEPSVVYERGKNNV